MDVNNIIMQDPKEEKYERALKKVKAIKGFYGHLVLYILVILFLVLLRADIISWIMGRDINIYAEHWIRFEFVSGWFLWGVAVLIHGLYVYRYKFGFGTAWEERKIREFMDKEENKSNERWS